MLYVWIFLGATVGAFIFATILEAWKRNLRGSWKKIIGLSLTCGVVTNVFWLCFGNFML
ncbi:hypothetical protein QJV45_17935 [Listeria booriae]|uniref:hypothetical protein n=1 Tax=Listeria booriae TaxID=1552123 RepID=UPI00164ED07A|nr:hypothetical protein [Listeria booriae]MBC6164683.1 hypothetical protein [Listeria booriae]MDT0112349.1 hypothetical protein [Listeria booriae]